MYKKAYGIIDTLAPLHVGATAGEESGNLNLIFRDQFTLTGIIPGSSLRGRLRAEMRQNPQQGETEANYWYGDAAGSAQSEFNNESIVKIEHASIVWLPVFSPGQPIVWVTCPRLLKRYKRITQKKDLTVPDPYVGSSILKPRQSEGKKTLFFNLGFLTVNRMENLSAWFPDGKELPAIVVKDEDISMIHDMALYRQSRVRLKPDQKVVDGGGFFNTEALPEGTILVFPIAIKNHPADKKWLPFNGETEEEIYLGGLESIGFGHCVVKLSGVES